MSIAYQNVVCAGVVPDPLQTLETLAARVGPVAAGIPAYWRAVASQPGGNNLKPI